jgi:hypothetical protein
MVARPSPLSTLASIAPMAIKHAHLAHGGDGLQDSQPQVLLPLDPQLPRNEDIHLIAIGAAGTDHLTCRTRSGLAEPQDLLHLGWR